jgi:putative nucleotidyltransferase with HDIG domain
MAIETTPASRVRKDGSFFDTSRTLRVVIFVLATIGCFFFLHNREVRVPMLELGTIAPRYIVAEVTFSFPDEEATAAARQAALFSVGFVYNIETEDILKRAIEFENSIFYDQSWRTEVPQSSIEEMCRANEILGRTLREIRFSDPKTIERMGQEGLDIEKFHGIGPIDLHQGICFPTKIWDFIRQRAFSEVKLQPATIDFLCSFLREKIWHLRQDGNATRKMQKLLRLRVPTYYTTLPAGSRIIDSGEKVTSRHITMLQAMKQVMAERRNLWHPKTILGSAILTTVLVITSFLFLRCYHPTILASNTTLFLIVSLVLLCLFLAKACEVFLLQMPHGLAEIIHYPLLIPFVAILLCILVNPFVAIFFSAMLGLFFNVCLAFEFQGFLLTNLLAAFICIFYTRTLRRRAEIVTICLRGWATACAIIIALNFYDHSRWGVSLLGDIGSSGVFMLLTAIIVVGLLPLFESAFRVLTDINLMEYMNPNQELLQRLMVEAPGTYQHSLLLGSVAEAAAQAIGGNGLFCRVATLYHDIGKVSIAQYFTENQQTGMNIHQLLTPVESARVIISHVQEGVNLARRAGLPEAFIDIIREHHGTGLVYYFYHKQLEAVGHDASLVDEREFRYSGPKPRSKEAAIVMIADSFEAACRSIDEINEEILTRLIDQIVREKMEDGQFDDCLLSFEELGLVKKALVRCLLSIGHFRIKYPAKIRLKTAPV